MRRRSASAAGRPAALDVDDAQAQLGDAVTVYLDGGTAPGGVASTIVDATSGTLRVVRQGAVTLDRLREVADVAGPDDPPAEAQATDDAGEPEANGG